MHIAVPLEFVYSVQHARHKDEVGVEDGSFHAYLGEDWLFEVLLRTRTRFVLSRMAADNLAISSVSTKYM